MSLRELTQVDAVLRVPAMPITTGAVHDLDSKVKVDRARLVELAAALNS